MFVLMCLIDKQRINTHIVEVLHIIGSAVKHFGGFNFGILQCDGTLLLLCGGTLLRRLICQDCKLCLQLVDLLFCLSGNEAVAIGVGTLHLLQNHHLLVDFILNIGHLTLLAVGYKFKCRLRHNNHIPIVVLNLSIKVFTTISRAIAFFEC